MWARNQRLDPNPDQTHGLGSSHVVGTSGPMSREVKGAQKGGQVQSPHTHAYLLPGTQAARHPGPMLPALGEGALGQPFPDTLYTRPAITLSLHAHACSHTPSPPSFS